jgi:hypothetical protein
MDHIVTILLVVAGIHVLANAWVSIVIYKSDKYESLQKVVQCILIWAIPIFGFSFVYLFFRFEGQPGRGRYSADSNLFVDPDLGLGLGDIDLRIGDHLD